ncbi:hypothetical protein JTE90_027778 [Oedothorax gibbosus]|uniref:Spermatogenesis-associated protein 1 C-terminal domain-containing protein n=1 Tax=Oedothorax gibbosus TaxID=931172 RepID=A0AAV6V931_9ARAC|nr:hypothetical protein JTE90_027778 [Oedothorax gibbosus]
MFSLKDRLLNAPKFYRRRMYGGLPLGGYSRSRFGNRRLRSILPGSPTIRPTRSYRTVFYPPSYFSGRLSRFLRSGQVKSQPTDDLLATCRRYDLMPVYVPLRRPYRPCQVIRMAKRAGELFIREKVRSAYRRWLDKRIAPYLGLRLGTPLGQYQQQQRREGSAQQYYASLQRQRSALDGVGRQQDELMHQKHDSLQRQQRINSAFAGLQEGLSKKHNGSLQRSSVVGQEESSPQQKSVQQQKRRSVFMADVSSMTPPIPPAALCGVATVDLWSDRQNTPIFPLPIIRHPAKYGRKKIARKRACALIRTPTPPDHHLPDLYPEDRLLTILSEVRNETLMRQRQREELLRKIKQLQSRAHQRREQGETSTCLREHLPHFARRAESAAVREMWRKRYLEAKKITPRLEEECSKLRQELEKLHRELLAKVQAGVWALLTISGKTERPSNKLSYKIMIARLLQEIEDLTRRVEGTRLKLHTEVKLRTMAEKDVRNLREELLKKKIQVTLTRNQEQAAIGNGLRQQYFISAMQ